MRTAWESSREEARKAGEEAAKLFEKAADIRQAGADKANARRDKSLTPEEADNKAIGEFRNAAAEASFNAAVAEAARLDGRTQVAKAAAEKAAKAAEQAANGGGSHPERQHRGALIEQAADLQAKAVEAQARQEQARQKSLQEQAEAQRASLAELDGQLEALRQKALQIKIAPDIGDAQKAFAAIDAEYQALKARIESNPITVPVSVPGAAPRLPQAMPRDSPSAATPVPAANSPGGHRPRGGIRRPPRGRAAIRRPRNAHAAQSRRHGRTQGLRLRRPRQPHRRPGTGRRPAPDADPGQSAPGRPPLPHGRRP